MVQAGVTRKQLNEFIKHTGLFFPIDPGADATLGGMAATRASGTNAVRYGTMRENVLSLKVVLADGRVIQTSRRAKKSAAGYDLTRLFVGSEGTLGIITEVTVTPLPGAGGDVGRGLRLPDIDGAANTVIQTIQSGIPVARCDLVCAPPWARSTGTTRRTTARRRRCSSSSMAAPRSSSSRRRRCRRSRASTAASISLGDASRRSAPALGRRATTPTSPACRLKPGSRALSTDVCVPISRLAECVSRDGRRMSKSASLPIPLLRPRRRRQLPPHVLVDPKKPAEIEKRRRFNVRVVERALAMEGTCTGEHGIGIGKQQFLRKELGDDVISVMRDIKHAFDPDNLMNPGKVVPQPS